jgi:light-regulated signal transduction histidine kinase (bacteriophytochrome)
MLEDITEQKRRDDEINTLNTQLQQRVNDLTALNKELEAFTYSVSHDLRAPLRHIDGYSKMLVEALGQSLSEEAQAFLARIRNTSQRMGRMIDELLQLSRTGRRDPVRQLTGLGRIVEELAGELRSEAGDRDIQWIIGELPFADCDPALVRHVFANLLANAVKFTRPRRKAVIEVGHRCEEGQTVFYVRDNGVGFDMKYADKLFGVFQRLHRQEDFEGTGIGLATVQRIIHKHEGRIWVEGAVDRGATFYFTLAPPPQSASRANEQCRSMAVEEEYAKQ